MYRTAKAAARERIQTIEFEYRRRYNLPATDPRFLNATLQEMLTDNLAHRYREDPKALEEVEDDDFDPDAVAALIGHEPDDWEDA